MLALDAWRATRCEGCGGDLNETLTHEEWEAVPPLRCHRCTAIQISQDRFDGPQPGALRWGAKKRDW